MVITLWPVFPFCLLYLFQIPVTDIDSEPASRVAEFKQRLRSHASEKEPDDGEDTEDAALFEAELDFEELSTSMDDGNGNLERARRSPCPIDSGRPAKIPRLDNHSSANDIFSDILNGTSELPSSTTVLNGVTESAKFVSPIARSGPSGSSRRKPSKLQLVQLKPTTEPDNCEPDSEKPMEHNSQDSEVCDKLLLNVS